MHYGAMEIFLRIRTKDPWRLISVWHAGHYLIIHPHPEKCLALLEGSLVTPEQVLLVINYCYRASFYGRGTEAE